jgi:ParB-like chromosome segregation protein Spo0J
MPKSTPPPIAPALVPLAALHPAPWNPRSIKDTRFKNLCESIQADPDFLWQRPILADAAGEIFAGNMRYRAVAHLGWREVPAIVSDVAPRLAKERAMRDNNQWGDLVEQDLAELLVGLQMDGSDLGLLGFPDDELTRLLDSVGALGDTPTFEPVGMDEQGRLDEKAKVTCPECGHEFTP